MYFIDYISLLDFILFIFIIIYALQLFVYNYCFYIFHLSFAILHQCFILLLSALFFQSTLWTVFLKSANKDFLLLLLVVVLVVVLSNLSSL